jgi:hypothetical protein
MLMEQRATRNKRLVYIVDRSKFKPKEFEHISIIKPNRVYPRTLTMDEAIARIDRMKRAWRARHELRKLWLKIKNISVSDGIEVYNLTLFKRRNSFEGLPECKLLLTLNSRPMLLRLLKEMPGTDAQVLSLTQNNVELNKIAGTITEVKFYWHDKFLFVSDIKRTLNMPGTYMITEMTKPDGV